MTKSHQKLRSATLAALALGCAAFAGTAARADGVGYQDLLNRLGAAAPTGSGVAVVQVEAGGSSYVPNQAHPDFVGKTFTFNSGAGTVSSHATEVGRSWYGTSLGMAKGVTNIQCYEAGAWIGSGYLRVGAGPNSTPFTPPASARIFNHSWIGSAGSNALDNESLRRADFAMRRDFTLMISGENNGAGSTAQPLMAMGYNGLAVGLVNGGHSAGATPSNIDGAGRQKPEIVAPGDFTSFSTPVVSAAAALLYETATQGALASETWARRGVVIKGCLLAGAVHRSTWANNAPQSGVSRGVATLPLDPVFGVDTVNINRSHLILTAGRTNHGSSLATAAYGGPWGWAQNTWAGSTPSTSAVVRFNLTTTGNTFSAVATWNRQVSNSQLAGAAAAPKVANLDMKLYRVVNEQYQPISGDAGVGVFASGNCVSQSAANNVEHVFLRDLDAGEYALEVKRVDSEIVTAETAIAWFIDQGPPQGDLNGDGVVTGADLGLLLVGWGMPGSTDLNGDGTTSGADIGLLMTNWIE